VKQVENKKSSSDNGTALEEEEGLGSDDVIHPGSLRGKNTRSSSPSAGESRTKGLSSSSVGVDVPTIVTCEVFDASGKKVTTFPTLEGESNDNGGPENWGLKVLKSFEPLQDQFKTSLNSKKKKKKRKGTKKEGSTNGGIASDLKEAGSSKKSGDDDGNDVDRDDQEDVGGKEDATFDQVGEELRKLQAQLWALEGVGGAVRSTAQVLLARATGEAELLPSEAKGKHRASIAKVVVTIRLF
jgi:hypothetical protein